MAIVAPFRGLHYNLAKVPNLTEVVTPPYDVIKPAEREVLAARNPYNMVHLILPQPLPGDDHLQNRYTRAAALFRQWQQEQVLVRDPEPAFYYWETDFEIQGAEADPQGPGGPGAPGALERRGHQAPRADLFRGQGRPPGIVQTGPGSFFPDLLHLSRSREPGLEPAARTTCRRRPLEDFDDTLGYHQRLYRVTEPEVLRAAHQAMADLTLFIADGHHRYETSLNYQKLLKQQYPQASPQAPFNYTLMYLSNIFDPDLVILMAHRLLGGPRVKHLDEAKVLGRLKEYFEIISLPTADEFGEAYEDFLQQTLAEAPPQEAAFILLGFGRKAWLLKMRPGVRQKTAGPADAPGPGPTGRGGA